MKNIQINDYRDIDSIEWNGVLAEMHAIRRQCRPTDNAAYWNRRAPSFADHAGKTHYPADFIKILNPDPSWTILDIGCGTGTLAHPLASKVARVTAIDQAEKMLELLDAESARRGFSNIRTIHARWEDDWNALGIGQHDAAIASRSLIVEDTRAAIEKLDAVAAKRIVISTMAGEGPHDRRIFEAVGRPLEPPFGYICLYNLLYQMGIRAEVSFIRETDTEVYDSFEHAVESKRWMFQDMTPQEVVKLEAFLKAHLVKTAGGDKWQLDYRRTFTWAVLHWDKEEQ